MTAQFSLPLGAAVLDFAAELAPDSWNGFPVPLVAHDFAVQIAEAVGDPIPAPYEGEQAYDGLCWEIVDEDAQDEDDTVNYPVPSGLKRRAGVEYGCGDQQCDSCYEPDTVCPDGPSCPDPECQRLRREGRA